jgi:small-conductance mechanosensitive channel
MAQVPVATEGMGQALRDVQRLASELSEAGERLEKRLAEEDASLDRLIRNPDAFPVTFEELRRTRLEVDSLSARLRTAEGRAEYRRVMIERLEATVLAGGNVKSAEALLEANRSLLTTLNSAIDDATRLLELNQEKLALLQSRMEVRTLIQNAAAQSDPRRELLEQTASMLVRDSARLSNAAAAVEVSGPESEARKRQLDRQSEDAFLRASLRNSDIQWLQMQRHVETLQALTEEPGLPVELLRDGKADLDSLATSIERAQAELQSYRQLLDDQQRLSEGENGTESQDDVRQLIGFQARELAVLDQIRTRMSAEFDAALTLALADRLQSRVNLPTDSSAWRRAALALSVMPALALSESTEAVRGIGWRLLGGTLSAWIGLLCVTLFLALAAAAAIRGFNHLLSSAPPGSGTRLLTAGRDLIWWLVPLGAWILIMKLFRLPADSGYGFLLLISVFPALHFVRQLLGGGAQGPGTAFRAPRAIQALAPILVLAIILSWMAALPGLAPSAASVLQYLSMLVLLTVAILAVRGRRALRTAVPSPPGLLEPSVALLGLAAGSSALVGLGGYPHLAWAILSHLAWLLAVVLLAAILLAVVGQLRRLSNTRLASRPNYHSAWWEGLVTPITWALGAAVIFGSIVLLMAGYASGTPSPLLGWISQQTGLSGTDLAAFWDTALGGRLAGALMQIALALTIAVAIWEVAKRATAPYMPKEVDPDADDILGDEGGGTGASRITTLMPLLRKFLLITLATITAMVVLSALGVNIGPLLAGAGVIGLAVGFGAQTLVKDIISGVFFLMDDAFRVGEYIDIAGVTGAVERISIRSLQLRHHNGPVHTVPYGEIQHVTNFSRDWAIMKFEIRVPFETDLDQVRRLIKKVGQQMLQDPELGPLMLEPLKSQGVNRMDDSALILRCKFTTVPGQQFYVRREAFTRIQLAFEDAGIKFAPRRVIVEAVGSGELDPETLNAAASSSALDAPKAAPAGDRG